jgi:hypothetical protein
MPSSAFPRLAAIEELNWDTIAEFIYSGRLLGGGAPPGLLEPKRSRFLKIVGGMPLLAWFLAFSAALIGGAMIGGITYWIVVLLGQWFLAIVTGIGLTIARGTTALDGVALTLAAVTALFSVWKVITKL